MGELLVLLAPPGEERLPMNRWANLLQQLQNWVRLSVVNAEYFIGHNVMEEVLRVRYLSQPEASDAVYATLAEFYLAQACRSFVDGNSRMPLLNRKNRSSDTRGRCWVVPPAGRPKPRRLLACAGGPKALAAAMALDQ